MLSQAKFFYEQCAGSTHGHMANVPNSPTLWTFFRAVSGDNDHCYAMSQTEFAEFLRTAATALNPQTDTSTERDASPSFEVFCPVYEGKLDSGALVIGEVRGFRYCDIAAAENDLIEELREGGHKFAADVIGVKFLVTEMRFESGQQSHPETGQWDFPPHVEFTLHVISTDHQEAP